MTEVFDLHSHILPGLDDGSGDMAESLRMLRQARGQGIRALIATPHYSGLYPNVCPDRIRALCVELEQRAAEEFGEGVRILPGQEIMYSEEALELLRAGKLLTIGGSRYVLIEFPLTVMYSYILSVVRELILERYCPVIAHGERYSVLRKEGRMDELRDQGALIQFNFRSLTGRWYDPDVRWCRRQLREERVDFMGTDMHNTGSRGPDLEKALAWMKSHLDPDYTDDVLRGNLLRIIESGRHRRDSRR